MTEAPKKTLVVGQLAGVFGVKGWLKVRSHTQPQENILKYSPWWLKTPHGLKLIEVVEHSVRPQGLVVHIKGVDDRDVAAQFGRMEIAVSTDLLPDLDIGDYYHHQLLGLKVVSHFSGVDQLLGVVHSVMETGANDVLVVEPCDGSLDERERLVPYVPELYVSGVSLSNAEIRVDWDPEF